MSSKQRITVVTVCDDHYMVMLAALVKSIELNHRTEEKIDLYIVEDNIKNKNRNKFVASFDSSVIQFHWIKLTEVIFPGTMLPQDRTTFPLNIYARLFIADFLNVDKILYLDVDMIFEADISLLWNTDITLFIAGAVVDKIEVVSNSWAGIKNYENLGLSPGTKYYNSGLLLINAIRWKKEGITEKVIKTICDNLEFSDFPDQYGLNIVLVNKWCELQPQWNCQSFSDFTNPYVIHFTGRKPIYQSYKLSQDYNKFYEDKFYEYLRLTRWGNLKPVPEYRRLLKKLYIQFEKKLWSLKARYKLKS